MYIADAGNERIQSFSSNLIYQQTYSFYQQETTDKYPPIQLAVNSKGNMFVIHDYKVDRTTRRVLIYDREGDFLDTLGTSDKMSPNYIGYPVDIAIDDQDQIYIVDQLVNQIKIFDRNHQQIASIGTGSPGQPKGQLHGPARVAIGPSKNLYITDGRKADIQVYDSALSYITTFPDPPTYRLLTNPEGVAVSSYRFIYVANPLRYAIQVFDPQYSFQGTIGATGGWQQVSPGSSEMRFDYPREVAFDKQNVLYVADYRNHRIQLLAPRSYMLQIVPKQEGDILIEIPGNSVQDAAGNKNQASKFILRYDQTSPSVQITSSVDSSNSEIVIPVAITFTEPVIGFKDSYLQYSNAEVSEVITTDSITFVVDLLPLDEGEVYLSLPDSVVQDQAGNLNSGAQFTTTFVPPITSIEHQLQHSEYLYPNPTQDKLYLPFLHFRKWESIRVINQQGQVVIISPPIRELDTSALPPGIYTIQIPADDILFTSKVIVH